MKAQGRPSLGFLLIANPGSPRCLAYQSEWCDFHGSDAGLTVVPWRDVLPWLGNLDDLPLFDRPHRVRLESPGRDEGVRRQLLAAGGLADAMTVPLPKGLLHRPGLQALGFQRVLEGLRRSFDARPHLRHTACPLAIARMFDKVSTSQSLVEARVPTPEFVAGANNWTKTYDRSNPRSSVYIKLNHGSSAAGMVRVSYHQREDKFIGQTTVVELDGQFWSTRQVSDLEGSASNRLVSFLDIEGAVSQSGIPMAQIDGMNFDVRVVCIQAKPVAHIFRCSPHPMTNLHLGGKRADAERCRALIPKRLWLDAMDHCIAAAQCFDSTIAGIDLVFDRERRKYYILEVNAFGDFFPGWRDAQGRSITWHELEQYRLTTDLPHP